MAVTNMTPEAKQYLLDIVFRGKEAARQLWVGLASRPMGVVSAGVLSEGEPDSGYARQTLFPHEWAQDGEAGAIITKELMFENTGKIPWPRIDLVFLVSSKDDSAILLSWGEIDPPRVVLPGDRLAIAMHVGF